MTGRHPLPFKCTIRPRSEEVAELVRRAYAATNHDEEPKGKKYRIRN